MHDPAFLCHNAQIAQERHRLSLFQDILLFPVMGQRFQRLPCTIHACFPFHGHFTLLAHKNRSHAVGGFQLKLLEILCHPTHDLFDQFFFLQILMKLLRASRLLALKIQFPFQLHRADPDF